MAKPNLPQDQPAASDVGAPDEFVASPPRFIPNGVPILETGPDPFDPAALRLPQDLSVALRVKPELVTIPVKKPSKEWFIRVHRNEAYHLPVAMIELKESNERRELYLVHQSLWEVLAAEATFTTQMLFLAINRQRVLFFWPIRLPGLDGRSNDWTKSGLEAARMATTHWVRVTSNMSLGAYEVQRAELVAEPEWPERPMNELLRIAFKDLFINSFEHPVLRRLRGEAI